MSRTTAVSAPGKVLIAGGYLVLDPAYFGIVVSTSSRFYTVVQDEVSGKADQIQVRSPQFLDANWNYSVRYESSVLVEADTANTSKNKFVHLALQNTISLASEIKGVEAVKHALSKGIVITIAGENDFYSQRVKLAELNLPRTLHSLRQIPPFAPTGVGLPDVHKTGLGSSAALITSLVSGLLVHLGAISPNALKDVDHSERRLAHNLAQFVHCLAQGKIGSGFDVSAAVFGSHFYKRFDPEVLQELMKDDATKPHLSPILYPTNTAWNYEVTPFQLPPLTRIMLADVDAGSDTPSLVGKVLRWRKDKVDDANKLWSSINTSNNNLKIMLSGFSSLYQRDPVAYSGAVDVLATLPYNQWETAVVPEAGGFGVVNAFYDVHAVTEGIRQQMREMGIQAGVPIEPQEQTDLLDACVSQPGVIGGGVPGAGGYDAVWLLVFDPKESAGPRPVDRVQDVWVNYTNLDVSPLSAEESLAKGTRLEDLESVNGLKAALG